MKILWVLLFFILTFPVFSQPQVFADKSGFNANTYEMEYSSTSGFDSLQSSRYNLNNVANGEFRGTFAFHFQIKDSVAGDTTAGGVNTNDSLYIFPLYYIFGAAGTNYIKGDTISWTNYADTSSHVTLLDDSLHTGTKWFWKNDPTKANVEGIPIEYVGLMIHFRDGPNSPSVHFKATITAN